MQESKHCSTGVIGDSDFHIRNRKILQQSQRRTIAMHMDCTENVMVPVYSALSVLYMRVLAAHISGNIDLLEQTFI